MDGYTQANTKKKEVAKKMIQGLTMNGGKAKGRLAMKPKMNGMNSSTGGGMKPKMIGTGSGNTKGMKADMTNKKADFSRNYTENAN